MDIIYEKLYRIKENPGLYLRKKSLHNLRMFISGYIARQREIEPDFTTSFDDFSSYVDRCYDYGAEALDWERILFYVTGDDEKAFDVFYELLDKYREEISEDTEINQVH